MRRVSCVVVFVGLFASAVPAANFGHGFKQTMVPVEGCTLSATVGGKGPTVLLLHGYAESAQMWKPLAVVLSPRFTVVAIDLPGIGDSSIPASGIDMTTSAKRIHEAVHKLGYERARVVGHDIGLMVAYAYAAQYPSEVETLTLMDAFLPGIGAWRDVYDAPEPWHFRFYGHTPELLVKGRERTYFEHFWNDFAADKAHSIPEADRQAYAKAYARPGRMAAGFAYFASFLKTADQFAEFGKTQLPMPVTSIGGEKANGAALGAQMKLISPNPTVVIIKGAGHWIMEEKPAETMAAVTQALEQSATVQK
jgi:pimeloyl-ACP methyl ester carboxylesterase